MRIHEPPNPLLPDAGDIVAPPGLAELADHLARDWPRLTRQALLEGPTNLLLETMHIEGQDYTFKQLRHFIEKAAGIGQEGVIAANDYKTSQRGAGANMSVDSAAGDAWVKMDTGTRNGLYLQTNDATINTVVAAAHATLPRLDQLVLQINDSNVTGLTNLPELKILAGTATSGATLDNRLGAAALGSDRILIADILVPAAAGSIVNANIRDRRPWARGAYWRHERAANGIGGGDYTTASTSFTALDNTNLAPRIECSGAPLRVTFRCRLENSNAGFWAAVQPSDAGVAIGIGDTFISYAPAAGTGGGATFGWDMLPAAGSHVLGMMFKAVGGGTAKIHANGSNWVEMTVEELVRQNAQNV